MKRLLLYNGIILAAFCGAWISGYYMSDYWMHIIDFGAPWSWFVAFFLVSSAVSLLVVHKQPAATVRCLILPTITTLMFYAFVGICDVAYDPFY
jgi:hypothetical protein